MGVSYFLWCYALLRSTHLVNHLPSSPLGGEVLLRCLHADCDLIALPPQVLGSVAFVHDPTPNISKLAPDFVKGVFVGYSPMQKGHRVYFSYHCKYVVSNDLTFFESSCYFSSTSSSTPPPNHLHPLYLPHPLHPL